MLMFNYDSYTKFKRNVNRCRERNRCEVNKCRPLAQCGTNYLFKNV